VDAEARIRCFHCGSPVATGSSHEVLFDGQPRPVCCAGCEAAARLVLSQGLGRFYEFRSGESTPPELTGRDWSAFDREAALRLYTQLGADGNRAVSLQLEGLRCAACTWLIENSLRRLGGVLDVQVNPAAGRAELRFDPRRVNLGQVLERLAALGYSARPLSFTPADADADGEAERRVSLQRLAVAGLGMMQVMTFAISLYAGALQGMDARITDLMRLVSLLVATPVVLYAAQPFFTSAWRTLRAGTLGMDVPVATSIGAAYLWSVWSTLIGHGAVYFDSAVMFTFFLLVGRHIEMSLRHRAGSRQHALARLLPDSVLRLVGARTERVAPAEIVAGDRIRILPGERVAADGVVKSGISEVDESLLTGESMPRLRSPGALLTAGTLNLSGVLEMEVTRVGPESTLAAISRLLTRAQASRPQIADQADRVAAWFVGVVLLLAAAVAWYWLRVDAARAFPTVLAVLVVTCPCALSLATPAALAAATARLAGAGLLVARARALEALAAVDCVLFDKTGTLTRGQFRLEHERILTDRCDHARCLGLAAALERLSTHPIASAFASIEPAAGVSSVETAVGRGVSGRIDGVRYRIGRPDYALEGCSDVGMDSEALQTTVVLADTAGALATFAFTDELRPDAGTSLERLRALGLTPLIASGDRSAVVATVASRLGEPIARGALDAASKVDWVHSLQRQGHRVATVGDGVNDAPVLAASDVSIAIGSGTDLARVSADLVLLGERLEPVVCAIATARRTRRVIRQNLAWAAVYNATAVPLAALGWLQPWMAALGMSLSSLLVVLNAMRLLRSGS